MKTKINNIPLLGKRIMLNDFDEIFEFCELINANWESYFNGYTEKIGVYHLPCVIMMQASTVDVRNIHLHHQGAEADGKFSKDNKHLNNAIPFKAFVNEDWEYFI